MVAGVVAEPAQGQGCGTVRAEQPHPLVLNTAAGTGQDQHCAPGPTRGEGEHAGGASQLPLRDALRALLWGSLHDVFHVVSFSRGRGGT